VPAARATHSHWPVGAVSSYSQDRLFHLPASAFHPNDPAIDASRSGSGGRHSRGFPNFQIARRFKRASKYHGREQTETRICPGSTIFYLLRTLPCIFASNRCSNVYFQMKPGLRGMWLIPSLILLLGVVVAGASHPPASVLVAFAPDENPTAARPATEKSTARAMKKAALKHKTPGR
jgi:hypothetical protein